MSGRSTVLLPVVAKSLVQSDSMAKTIPPSVQLSRRRRRRVAAAAEQRETPFRPIRSARRPHRSPERSRPRRRRRLAVASSCAVPGRRGGRRSPGRQRLEHAVRQLVLTPLLLLLVPTESTTGMVIERRAAPSASFRRGRRQAANLFVVADAGGGPAGSGGRVPGLPSHLLGWLAGGGPRGNGGGPFVGDFNAAWTPPPMRWG